MNITNTMVTELLTKPLRIMHSHKTQYECDSVTELILLMGYQIPPVTHQHTDLAT